MQEQTSAARERAEKALGISLGMASPLWFAFGAAASVGVTWWWMTRWTKAVNLEAMTSAMPATPMLAIVESAPALEIAPEMAPEPVAGALVEAAQAATAVEPLVAPEPILAAPLKAKTASKPVPAVEPAPAPVTEPDDLTRLVGIGPKLADALAARGVTQFAQLAAWTADDLATMDAALSLKGRAVRDAWVAQAKRFAASLH
ncbi:MAG: helix-hairpin-helix domain-containing protein [Caulobacteraceae bacterium]